MPVLVAEAIHLKIEESSQFMQANAVAQRVRQLILGAAPKVKTPSRRPTAIALAELKAGKLEVYDPREAAELLAEDSEDLSEEERAAAEAARASFEQMFAEAAGGGVDLDASPE
jgi:DNA-directed RNA polymerase subunit K/omega